MISFGGGQTNNGNGPDFTAGWTRIISATDGTMRAVFAVYRVAANNSPLTVTFTSTRATSSMIYSSGVSVRNVKALGALAASLRTSVVQTTVITPALALQKTDATSMVLFGYYAGGR